MDNDLTAHPGDAVPELVPSFRWGPRPKPRYRSKPVGLREHALAAEATPASRWSGGRAPARAGLGLPRPARAPCQAARHRPAGRRRLPAQGVAAGRVAPGGPGYWLSTLPAATTLTDR